MQKAIFFVVAATIIGGLLGFYGGRYYERKQFEKLRTERINSGQRQQVNGARTYIPGTGTGPGNGYFHRD